MSSILRVWKCWTKVLTKAVYVLAKWQMTERKLLPFRQLLLDDKWWWWWLWLLKATPVWGLPPQLPQLVNPFPIFKRCWWWWWINVKSHILPAPFLIPSPSSRHVDELTVIDLVFTIWVFGLIEGLLGSVPLLLILVLWNFSLRYKTRSRNKNGSRSNETTTCVGSATLQLY